MTTQRFGWLATVAIGCSGPPPEWGEAFDVGDDTALSGVWGSGPDDVYMVGGDEARGAVYHFDGATWTADDSIDTEDLLVWVFGFGPDDIWIVGESGTVLRGSFGSFEAVDIGTDEPLWGVWGASADDVWIVGGSPTGDAPTLIHWDGTKVEPFSLAPEQNDRKAVALFKVWGIGGRTFAVGQDGLIIEFDGEQWIQMAAGQAANDDFVALWGSSVDNVVAVGGRGSARVAVFDGSSWTTTEYTSTPGLNAVTFVSADEVVVGGVNGWLGRFDPVTGELLGENVVDSVSDVHATWFDGVETTWGVSGRFTEPFTGTALRRAAP